MELHDQKGDFVKWLVSERGAIRLTLPQWATYYYWDA